MNYNANWKRYASFITNGTDSIEVQCSRFSCGFTPPPGMRFELLNPETECMEREFYHFPAGTSRMDIWEWFDKRYSGGVAELLYGKTDYCAWRNKP